MNYLDYSNKLIAKYKDDLKDLNQSELYIYLIKDETEFMLNYTITFDNLYLLKEKDVIPEDVDHIKAYVNFESITSLQPEEHIVNPDLTFKEAISALGKKKLDL